MAKKPGKKDLGRFAAAYFAAAPEKQSMCLQLISNAVFMEEQLTKLMFEAPSDHTIEKITITEGCVEKGEDPEIVYNPEKKPTKMKAPVKGRNTRKKVTA